MRIKILILCLFIAGQVNSQWYFSQFGVTDMNELNEKQLNLALEQSEKTIGAGQALTAVGLLGTIIGFVVYTQGLNEIMDMNSDINEGLNKATTGILVATGFGTLASIGIPTWIVGNNRKNVINIHLVKFQDQGYMPSAGIRLYF
jgi:hypothetical protein